MNEALSSEHHFDYSQAIPNSFAVSLFEVGKPVNLVALADAVDVLKAFEFGTQCNLAEEQRRQALFVIEAAKLNLQASIRDVVDGMLTVASLKQFALDGVWQRSW